MLKKLAELKVNNLADYNDSIVKALQNAGFSVVYECGTTTDTYYIVAVDKEEK